MSEEAQEARNKDIKRYREFHSRKFSRNETTEDMFHMLLISSDPIITNLRSRDIKRSALLPKDVLTLLKVPSFDNVSVINNQNYDSDSD